MSKKALELHAPPGWERSDVRRYICRYKNPVGVTTEVCMTKRNNSGSYLDLWVSVNTYRKKKDRNDLATFSDGLSRLVWIKDKIDEFAEFQDIDTRVIIKWADTKRKRVYSRQIRYGYRQARYKGKIVLSKIYKYDESSQRKRVYSSLSRYFSEIFGQEVIVVDAKELKKE